MPRKIHREKIDAVKAELALLDQTPVDIDGVSLKPSNCYYFGNDPLHLLYNTNCPDTLKEKIEAILDKYSLPDENSTQQY